MKSYEQAYNEFLQSKESIQSKQKRLMAREQELTDKTYEFERVKLKMEEEQRDVSQLENLSLSKLLAKISGNYDEKYRKEYEEYIHAKLQFDELSQYINNLRAQMQYYKNEIETETVQLKSLQLSLVSEYEEAKERTDELEEKRRDCYHNQTEIKEAIAAVLKVRDLAVQAIETFNSAKGWSTYDTFFNGGLIADLAKYSKIDEAEEITNVMRFASNAMKKELADVQMQFEEEIDTIDGSVRGFDIIFDNIFTDWSVRDRIKDNLNVLGNYKYRLEGILKLLRSKEAAIVKELENIQF